MYYLNHESKNSFPLIDNKALWTGILRKHNPILTDAHENEMFNYLFNEGSAIKKEDFMDKVAKRVSRIDFNANEALALHRNINTGADARHDTNEAQKRIYEIDERTKKLRDQYNKALTKVEKQQINQELLRLQEEKETIARNINLVLKTQSSLFGVKKKKANINTALLKYVEMVLANPKIKVERFIIKDVSYQEAKQIFEDAKVKTYGYKHVVDSSHILHVQKRHFKPDGKNKEELPITIQDFLLIEEIITNYDSIIRSVKNGILHLKYQKEINSIYFYIEQVQANNRYLSLKTFYKNAKG